MTSYSGKLRGDGLRIAIACGRFNDLITEALERYMEDRRAFLQGAGRSALFLTKRGRHLSARDLQALMRHHLERAGRAEASGVPRAELEAVGSFAVSETPAVRALGEREAPRRGA